MDLIKLIDEIIQKKHLLNHPYYQAWSQGQLTLDDLQVYAAQYYHQVKTFPRFISRVHSECPEIAARKVLLTNLIDEELHGTDHPSLWMQFATGLGNDTEAVRKTIPVEETQTMVDTYYELATGDWRDGLCALYAYEKQVPEVAASKIAGLKEFYGIDDAATLEFFTAHQMYDVEHADQVAQLIKQYVPEDRAIVATQKATQALWGFLDGMCRVGNIACH